MKVLKTMVFGLAGVCVVVVVALIAIEKYRQSKEEAGEEVEQIFVDLLNMGEVKQWFAGKILTNEQKGLLFYPTPENVKQWKVHISDSSNMLIQAVYDTGEDKVINYREIIFSDLSPKLKELLDANSGTLVIEK